MKWQLQGLAVALMVSIAGCGPATTRYATKMDPVQPSTITAVRTKGTRKPRGKPFPLYRKPGLFGTYGQTEHDGQTLFTYSIIGWPLDLIATLTTPFWGYEKYDSLKLGGELRGKLAVTGDVPSPVTLEYSLGEGDWSAVSTSADNSFTLLLDRTLDLRKNPLNLAAIPLRLRLPWQERMAATGSSSRPNPETMDYALKLSDGDLAILKMPSGEPASLTLTVNFMRVEDPSRIKELAAEREQARLEKAKRTRAEAELREIRQQQPYVCPGLSKIALRSERGMKQWGYYRCDEYYGPR